MSLARQLAERVTALRHEDFPPEATAWGKVAVLDTLGVTLAGSDEEAPRIVEDVLELQSGDGPCLIFGASRRVRPLDAALVNGTAAHALDYDNTAKNLGGHVSAVMLPALLAAAEAHGAGGRDLLLAHAAGYEVGAAIGRSVNPHHTEKGWHPTATVGVFAVTAACAKLLKLTAGETETALALATSLAAGTKANFGTMTKPLHAGLCARNGLLAVLLARKGFTANPGAFEHKQGYFNVFNGPGNYDAARALAGWGDWEIVSPGASYKIYPCCYSTHAAVEATLNLVRRHGPFDARAVAPTERLKAPVAATTANNRDHMMLSPRPACCYATPLFSGRPALPAPAGSSSAVNSRTELIFSKPSTMRTIAAAALGDSTRVAQSSNFAFMCSGAMGLSDVRPSGRSTFSENALPSFSVTFTSASNGSSSSNSFPAYGAACTRGSRSRTSGSR